MNTRAWVIVPLLVVQSAANAGFTIPTVVNRIPMNDPAEVAVNPGAHRLYVSTGTSEGQIGRVAVVDTLTDTVLNTVEVNDGPQGVAVDAFTNRLYVVNVRSETVSVIDTQTNAIVETITGFGYRPRLVAVNPETDRIYVTNHGNGAGTTLSVINGSMNDIVDNITVGAGPHGVAVNPTTNRIYTANDSSGTVSVIDGATDTVIATVPVGSTPRNVAVDIFRNRVYIANEQSNTVSVIDGASNQVIDTIPVGSLPRGLSVDPTSNQIYLGTIGDDSFSVIDGSSNTVIHKIFVGVESGSTAFDSELNRAYVTSRFSNYTSVISSIPEPSTIWLLTGGLVSIGTARIWRRRT